MATGSGLDAQLMFKAETTWGTAVTVDKAVEFDSEDLKFEPTWLEPVGLRVGTKFKRVSRVRRPRQTVPGSVTLEWATKNMGTPVKHMTGSALTAPVQIGATTAYKQCHIPGDFRGLGLTIQVGRPEPSTGTVRPHTYAGCKVIGWEFSLNDNAIPTLKLTVNGRSESTATALAAATFATGATVFDFSQAVLKLGGTASTGSGETSISGGTAVAAVVRAFTLTVATPMATERFGIGNAGLKAEQLENATPTITGKLEAEFAKTELYDVFQANTTTALELVLTGSAITGGAGNNYLLSFVIPAIKLKTAAPAVSGPDIVQMSTDFEGYSDETNPVYQVKIVSDETAL